MELLSEICEQDIGLQDGENFSLPYRLHKSARAVLFNAANEIAIMRIAKRGYHKLPGGGLKQRESIREALRREVLEETGHESAILRDIGMIIEYRNQLQLLQISYCFFARTVGPRQKLQLTKNELAKGFEPVWVPLETAIHLLQADTPDSYAGKFIQRREINFLQKAEELAPEVL